MFCFGENSGDRIWQLVPRDHSGKMSGPLQQPDPGHQRVIRVPGLLLRRDLRDPVRQGPDRLLPKTGGTGRPR